MKLPQQTSIKHASPPEQHEVSIFQEEVGQDHHSWLPVQSSTLATSNEEEMVKLQDCYYMEVAEKK
jgi:hypothetical protein